MLKMLQLIQEALLLAVLFYCAWTDYKRQEISVWILCLCGTARLLFHIIFQVGTIGEILTGLALGGLLLAVSWLTQEMIGYGDGLIVLISGMFLGFWKNFSLVFIACLLSGGVALFLLLTGKSGKKDRIPFAPFLLVAYVVELFV